MDRVRIDPHLNPKPGSLELHPAAIGRPLDLPHEGPELTGDLVDRRFEVAAGFFEGPTVLECKVDQWHLVLGTTYRDGTRNSLTSVVACHFIIYAASPEAG